MAEMGVVIEHHRSTQQQPRRKATQLRQRNPRSIGRSSGEPSGESDHPLAPPFVLGQYPRRRPVTALRNKDFVGFLDVSARDQLQQRGREHHFAAGPHVRQDILHPPTRRVAVGSPFLVVQIAAEPQQLHPLSAKCLNSHTGPDSSDRRAPGSLRCLGHAPKISVPFTAALCPSDHQPVTLTDDDLAYPTAGRGGGDDAFSVIRVSSETPSRVRPSDG